MCLIERTKLMFGIHIFSAKSKSVNKVFYFSIPSVELCFKHYARTGVITYIAAEGYVCFQGNWSELQALSLYSLVKRHRPGRMTAISPRPWQWEEAPMTAWWGTYFFWCCCAAEWMSHRLFLLWEFLHFHFSLQLRMILTFANLWIIMNIQHIA